MTEPPVEWSDTVKKFYDRDWAIRFNPDVLARSWGLPPRDIAQEAAERAAYADAVKARLLGRTITAVETVGYGYDEELHLTLDDGVKVVVYGQDGMTITVDGVAIGEK